MYKLISHNNENRTLQNLNSLVHRLTQQLSCLKESHLPLGQANTQMLKKCNMTGVNPNELPKTLSSYVNCNQSINALNKILFCQQIIKCNKQLSADMIENMQEA